MVEVLLSFVPVTVHCDFPSVAGGILTKDLVSVPKEIILDFLNGLVGMDLALNNIFVLSSVGMDVPLEPPTMINKPL